MGDDTTRYQRGLEKLCEIDGAAGERVIAALADVAPDFARLLIEFPFGDVYSRPGLDLRSREIATIAALTIARITRNIPICRADVAMSFPTRMSSICAAVYT